jgi:dolichol kinase
MPNTDDSRTIEIAGLRRGRPHDRQLSAAQRTELRRKSWHLLPGLLPFIYAAVPHHDPLIAPVYLVFVLMAAIFAITLFVHSRYFQRRGEDSLAAPTAWYIAAVLGTLFLFPAQPEYGMVVLTVLAFGDGMATIAGVFLQSSRLPWNSKKSWAGFLAFFFSAAPMAVLAFGAIAQPRVSFAEAAVVGISAAAAGTMAESWRSKINDNGRVGLAAAVTVILVSHLLGLE